MSSTVVVCLCGLFRLSWSVLGKEACHNSFRQMSSTVLCGLLRLSWIAAGKETSYHTLEKMSPTIVACLCGLRRLSPSKISHKSYDFAICDLSWPLVAQRVQKGLREVRRVETCHTHNFYRHIFLLKYMYFTFWNFRHRLVRLYVVYFTLWIVGHRLVRYYSWSFHIFLSSMSLTGRTGHNVMTKRSWVTTSVFRGKKIFWFTPIREKTQFCLG